jgi:hypothetical protein
MIEEFKEEAPMLPWSSQLALIQMLWLWIKVIQNQELSENLV